MAALAARSQGVECRAEGQRAERQVALLAACWWAAGALAVW